MPRAYKVEGVKELRVLRGYPVKELKAHKELVHKEHRAYRE